MNLFLDLLLIQFIIVMITDITGFVQDGLEPLVKALMKTKVGHLSKIFVCSLCQTHWVGLIYLLIVGQFNLMTYAYLLLLSVLTPLTGSIIHLFIDFFESVITGIYEYFNL